MGSLIIFDPRYNVCFSFLPLMIILSLGCNAIILVFSGYLTVAEPKLTIQQKVIILFGKLAFQNSIYFSVFFAALFFVSIISLISWKNLVKYLFKWKIFEVKKIYYIFLIASIDILTYLFVNSLITPYATLFSITEYFTEPIYLFYLIIYYKYFKKAHFYLKQIIISYVFFILGLILMIIGLSKYYCETCYITIQVYSPFRYDEQVRLCKEGVNNYFNNYHLSIIFSIFVIPLLFFIKMFLSKRYMEITKINSLVLVMKTDFIEFVISTLIFLIVSEGKINLFILSTNKTNLGLYSFGNDIQELIFLFYLQKTSLLYIFFLLVLRKLHFHLLAGIYEYGHYFMFLIPPIILNIIGLISFSCHGDKKLGEIINGPLIAENTYESNDDSLNQEVNTINNEDITNLNYNDFNDKIKKENYKEEPTIEGDTSPFPGCNAEIIDKLEEYKTKILNLEAQIKSLSIKNKSLQVRNQALEDMNEKLSDKIGYLCEKYNINEDEDELAFIKQSK